MEENQDLFNSGVDQVTAQELNETSRWARLLSIIIFSLCGVVLLAMFVASGQIQDSMSTQLGSGNGSTAYTFVVIIVVVAIAIVSLMMFFLLRAANSIRSGLRLKDQALFNRGLSDMKVYFAIVGVFSILGLLGNLLSLL